MKFVSLTIILLTCVSTSLAAQDERRTVRAIRLQPDERIVLDGRLDEEAWRRAVPARDFIQQDPDNGKPATEPTEVRILFTSTALYMGVTAYDSEPDEWLGYHRRRDDLLQSDDRFMWNIDTFNNQQRSEERRVGKECRCRRAPYERK